MQWSTVIGSLLGNCSLSLELYIVTSCHLSVVGGRTDCHIRTSGGNTSHLNFDLLWSTPSCGAQREVLNTTAL